MGLLDGGGALLDVTQDLIEFCCEQVESSQNSSVRSQVVPGVSRRGLSADSILLI